MSLKSEEMRSELRNLLEETKTLVTKLNDLYVDFEEMRDFEGEIDDEEIEDKIQKIEETINIITDEQTKMLLQKQLDDLKLTLSNYNEESVEHEDIENLFDEIRDTFNELDF